MSIQKQKELCYKLFDHTPYRAYTRKNIGYLYALQVIFLNFLLLAVVTEGVIWLKIIISVLIKISVLEMFFCILLNIMSPTYDV